MSIAARFASTLARHARPFSAAAAAGPRPFAVLGVQQIAVGAPELAPLQHLWTEVLGVPATGSHRSEKENVDEVILTLGEGAHAVEIDLMQPLNPEVAPRVHLPPLNHIGLWVDDIHKAVEWLGATGVRFAPGGIRAGAAGHDVAFIHPKGGGEGHATPLGGCGVLIELVQAPPDVVAALKK